MLRLFKRILFAIAAALIGSLLIQFCIPGSPWQTLGRFVLILAAVAILYDIRDAIQLGLQQFGISVTKFEILTHLCAGLLLLLAISMSSDDPRLQGAARWALIIGLPMLPYLYAFFHGVFEHSIDKVFSSGRKPKRRSHKR
jgi:hypothetical protein